MIIKSEGLKTTVTFLPYVQSTLDSFGYLQSSGKPMTVRSVEGDEDMLVEVILPTGESVIARADQLITAVQKCVR